MKTRQSITFVKQNSEKEREGEMGDTLAALRALMASHSPPLDALVVPSEDYHQVLLVVFCFLFF